MQINGKCADQVRLEDEGVDVRMRAPNDVAACAYEEET